MFFAVIYIEMRTKKLKTATGRTDLPSLPNRVITFEEAEARALFAKFGAEDKVSYIQKIDKNHLRMFLTFRLNSDSNF